MKRKHKVALWTVVALVIVAVCIVSAWNGSDAELNSDIMSEEWDYSSENSGTYATYLAELSEAGKLKRGSGEVYIEASDYSSAEPGVDSTDNGILTKGGSQVEYNFTVPDSGTYYIEVGYFPTADQNASIIRKLYINGEVPFEGADEFVFDRIWVDDNKSWLMDNSRNHGAPSQIQSPRWTSVRLESRDRSEVGPYLFYFEKGNNTLALEGMQSTLELSYIKLIPAEEVKSYEAYLAEYDGAKKVDGTALGEKGIYIVQAEDTIAKSSAALIPQNNRTSTQTMPYHPSNILMNTIGGSTWDELGENITWEVDVPETGLYRIAARYMQAENRDFYSAREVKINGELPFAEAASVQFFYDSGFQVSYLGNEEDGAYYFYLQEGKNEITLTVTLGDLAYAVDQTGISVKNFNNLYREITAVMSSSPDEYRDYNIVSFIPDIKDIMKKEYVRLAGVLDSLGESMENTTKARVVSKLLMQLEDLIARPDDFAVELAIFNDNLTALSEWMLGLGEQPLQLDYLMVCGEGCRLPKAEGNIFQKIGHSFLALVGSFTNDYIVKEEGVESRDKEIEVWIATTTRDQYDIVQRMINNELKDRDYSVALKMVGADVVLPSSLTGDGPDVAIQLNYTMPSNFAFRGAGYDLTQFADYEEVASWFAEGAMDYFKYNGGVYAFPDQMSFPVLFYRTDILDSMGLEVPDTWDDLIAMLPYLQAENMKCYFVTTGHTVLGGASSTSTKPVNAVFTSMLFQNGQDFYRNNGEESNLDNLDAMLTFKKWTEFYTKQSFALTMSVVTRFRTGEVPVLIEDYTYVNQISAAAPEIDGVWDIAPIPGTLKEDGSIDRSTACMVGASMMVKNSVEENDTVDESWDFLKWWVSEDTQLQYAQEQKAILGAAGEFPIANIAALKARAAEKGNLDTVEEITRWLRGVEQVPGGYLTAREVENAFLETVNDILEPVDTLYSKLRSINAELKSKREEFGLVSEGKEAGK